MNLATTTASPWWHQIEQVHQLALQSGALIPITTQLVTLHDGPLRFSVRMVQPAVKPSPSFQGGKTPDHASTSFNSAPSSNPFLPYDRQLYVCDVLDAHVCLLNKYCVTDHHLLLVTKQFRSQDEPLDAGDFDAMDRCLTACQQLSHFTIAFYNGGRRAGASQPHKHLQLLSWPTKQPPLPLWEWLAQDPDAWQRGRLTTLRFEHQLTRIPRGKPLAAYQSLMEQRPEAPYNLLWTGDWMLRVPRQAEHFEDISLNALAFAGGLLVRSEQQLRKLREVGPTTALQAVTFPSDS